MADTRSHERKARLAGMNRLQRWFYSSFWLLRALFLNLTPFRRRVLFVGLLPVLTSRLFTVTSNGKVRVQEAISWIS